MSVATGQATSSSSRACRNCATAKAKCVSTPQSDNSVCERCARLQLNCEAQLPIVRKHRESKALKLNRVENKLDRIITLLSSPHSSRLPGGDLHHPHLPSTTSSTQISADSTSVNLSDLSGHEVGAADLRPPTCVAIDNTALPCRQSISESRPPPHVNPDEEGVMLNIFQAHMSIYFPFVILSSISTTTLRADRPFLFSTIMLGASRRKVTKQTSAGRSLLQSISERYFLDGQTSLDLLQAILVYIVWCSCQYRNNPQISILIQLAESLVVELGLNKTTCPTPTRQQQSLQGATTPPSCEGPAISQYHSSEEMRAFLGCFYLNSVISSSFMKVVAMKHIPYIEECCTTLEQANEFSTDVCLVKLIRAQALARKIEQSLPSNDLEPLWNPMTPVGMVVKALEAEVEKLPTLDMQANVTFLLQYHCVQISLYKVGLCEPRETPGHYNFPQMELLYSCLLAVRAYFNAYFLIPADLYFALPAVVWIQLADIIVVLSRLLLIHVNGWDLSHARKLVDLAAIFSRLEQNFEDASRVAQRTGMVVEDEDIFHAHAIRMRWGKTSYEARLASELAESQLAAVASERADIAIPRDFALYDNSFWQESLVDWDAIAYTGATGA